MDGNDQANLDNGGNNDQNNGGGNAPPAWMAQLDKDLQGNASLTQFRTIGEMGKAFLDMEGKSKGAITVPGENATDEDRAAFYGKLGRPEAADKYSFTKPADLPEGVPHSPEIESAYKEHAFNLGLSETQAAAVYGWYYDLAKQGHAELQKQEAEATEAAVNALKDDWKGDTFKVNTELAVRAFAKFGGEDGKKFIEETKIGGVALGDHPAFLRIFAAIGKTIGDDSMSGERGNNSTGFQSDEDKAKARFPNTYK